MQLTFLGTGSTSAVPLYGCECNLCILSRTDITRRRLPASALLEAGDTRILLDAGRPDLSSLFPSGSFDAFCLTHFHVDHVQGLFPMRWGTGNKIDVYCPPDSEGCADLYKNSGLLNFLQQKKFVPFQIGQVTVTPVPLIHSKVNYGYCFEYPGCKLAYLTDTLGLPPATEDFLQEWGDYVMVLDCSYPPQEKAKNHNDWMHAIKCVDAVRPNETWLTHIGHDLDLWLTNQINLPRNVKIARDMEIIDVLQVQHGDA